MAACSSGPAKPDAYCGTGGAPTTVTVAGTGFSLMYDNLSASANNDCPDPMAPMGVVSLTIEVPTGSPQFFTLCIQRPDRLAAGQPLDGMAIKVQDITGTSGGCSFVPDRAVAPTGTATATGICNNGTSKAGFALTLDGTVQLKRTCGATMDSVSATLSGTVAISGPP